MKIIFLGYMYNNAESDIKKMSAPNPISGHKFQMNLLKGFMENTNDVYVFNTPCVRHYPHYPQKLIGSTDFLVEGKAVGKSIGFINFLGINYITRYIGIKRAVTKYIRENIKENEKCVLVCYNNFLPIVFTMLKCKRRYKNVYTCSVIGDIHGKRGLSCFVSCKSVKALISYFMGILADRLSQKIDCFAFLTENIAHALKVENKPFVVTEGMYTVSDKNNKDSDTAEGSESKIIFYAGSLCEEYGIVHLIRAFEMITEPDYRLCLAGKGSAEKYISEYALKDNRIEYLGYITPQEVDKQQKRASVLVSPRVSKNNEFVKYSFPSKTLECLASGKPYIAHKLPCDPLEYADHIQYADDESDEALARKIKEICSMAESERNMIGAKAKKFIEEEKNPTVMTKRIVRMLKDTVKENEGENTNEDKIHFG